MNTSQSSFNTITNEKIDMFINQVKNQICEPILVGKIFPISCNTSFTDLVNHLLSIYTENDKQLAKAFRRNGIMSDEIGNKQSVYQDLLNLDNENFEFLIATFPATEENIEAILEVCDYYDTDFKEQLIILAEFINNNRADLKNDFLKFEEKIENEDFRIIYNKAKLYINLNNNLPKSTYDTLRRKI